MIDGIVDALLHIPSWVSLLLVFLGPALESSIFVGVVVPGEIVVIIGGVIASQHRLSLAAVLAAAVSGAILGDQIGYYVGKRWGATLLRRIPDRLLDDEQIQRARQFIRRLGPLAVIGGRWTASLRALVPGLCGMADLRYRTFAVANVLGGSAWAVTIVLLGYAAGSRYKALESKLSTTSYILLGLVVVAVAAFVVTRKVKARR